MRPAAALLLIALVALPVGCGGDDDSNSLSRIKANETDMAFATDMLTHHEQTLDAADVARTRGKDPIVRRSARDLITLQSVEAQTLRSVKKVLAEAGVEKGDLGVGPSALNPGELRNAGDFDRAYADAMIRHHELALKMTAAELRSGEHAELRRMSRDIADLARFQIRQLKRVQ
jgi:uncharacterized protein (DUF305 family)